MKRSSFHTSGSAQLDIGTNVYDFIYNHLKDIHNTNTYTDIEFNERIPESVVNEFKTYEGFKGLQTTYIVRFSNLTYKMNNEDVGKTIEEIKSILKAETNKLNRSLEDNYTLFIKSLLSLSNIKSVFIECILANMYLVDTEIYRYALKINPHVKPTRKLSVRQIATFVSPILAMLFQPNIINYQGTKDEEIIESTHHNSGNLSIFEKIWFSLI